jgi:anaerobic selenocysteine-containing dehydrogenase
MPVPVSGTQIVRGACPQDWPDTCAFLYHVQIGKLVDVTGDPDHPMTRGGLCVKLNDYADHLNVKTFFVSSR